MILDTDHMEKVSHHFGFFYEFWNGYFVKITLNTGHKEMFYSSSYVISQSWKHLEMEVKTYCILLRGS